MQWRRQNNRQIWQYSNFGGKSINIWRLKPFSGSGREWWALPEKMNSIGAQEPERKFAQDLK